MAKAMISIITAVRNQLGMNKLFYKYLELYTQNPFQLIIIDNASTDGSGKYFADRGATVIRNEKNFSYPYCQNQGLTVANGSYVAFLNNDILVSPDWDVELMFLMDNQEFDFLSPASNDPLETHERTKQIRRRWNKIENALLLFGRSESNLQRMSRIMYGDWEVWQRKRYDDFDSKLIEGFSGSCIIATEKGLDKIGRHWDEQIQAADFDFYLRTKERSIGVGDVKPVHVALNIYFHHFTRLTTKSKDYVPFADSQKYRTLENKWGNRLDSLLRDIDK